MVVAAASPVPVPFLSLRGERTPHREVGRKGCASLPRVCWRHDCVLRGAPPRGEGGQQRARVGQGCRPHCWHACTRAAPLCAWCEGAGSGVAAAAPVVPVVARITGRQAPRAIWVGMEGAQVLSAAVTPTQCGPRCASPRWEARNAVRLLARPTTSLQRTGADRVPEWAGDGCDHHHALRWSATCRDAGGGCLQPDWSVRLCST